jgi:hypothetical protein
MSYSVSTLLTRNLHDVFGENDPARRRGAIDEIFNEDCVFYDPGRGVRLLQTFHFPRDLPKRQRLGGPPRRPELPRRPEFMHI